MQKKKSQIKVRTTVIAIMTLGIWRSALCWFSTGKAVFNVAWKIRAACKLCSDTCPALPKAYTRTWDQRPPQCSAQLRHPLICSLFRGSTAWCAERHLLSQGEPVTQWFADSAFLTAISFLGFQYFAIPPGLARLRFSVSNSPLFSLPLATSLSDQPISFLPSHCRLQHSRQQQQPNLISITHSIPWKKIQPRRAACLTQCVPASGMLAEVPPRRNPPGSFPDIPHIPPQSPLTNRWQSGQNKLCLQRLPHGKWTTDRRLIRLDPVCLHCFTPSILRTGTRGQEAEKLDRDNPGPLF